MTTIDKMDLALDIVYKYKHKRISILKFITDVMEAGNFTVVELSGCMSILEEDGYIRKFIDDDVRATLIDYPFEYEARQTYTFIVITMKGMLFKETGGYEGEFNRNHAKERMASMLQKGLVFLTFVLAISAVPPAVYYLFELCKSEHQNLAIGIPVYLLIFLLGCISGLIIGLLIVELRSKRKT